MLKHLLNKAHWILSPVVRTTFNKEISNIQPPIKHHPGQNPLISFLKHKYYNYENVCWLSSVYRQGLKYWKPTSNGQRWRVTIDRRHIWPGKPFNPLTKGVAKTGGRNHSGRTTAFHRGGGHRKKLRMVDFKRNTRDGEKGIVERLEYDPNRTGYLALVKFDQGEDKKTIYSYILAPDKLNPGDAVETGKDAPIKVGNTFELNDIPTGIKIHNIEMRPGQGGTFCRSAGCAATLIQKGTGLGKGSTSDKYCVVKLPSGEQRKVLGKCRATIGVVSNHLHKNRVIGKAGISRWMGRRPVVRGVAMNPIDHPHGGGEGKTSGGRPSCTPWGVPCKGYRTRNRNKLSNKFIVLSKHKAKSRKKRKN